MENRTREGRTVPYLFVGLYLSLGGCAGCISGSVGERVAHLEMADLNHDWPFYGFNMDFDWLKYQIQDGHVLRNFAGGHS